MLIIFLTALCYSGFYFVPNDANLHGNSTNVLPAAISENHVYQSTTFWMFVVLMSLGTINFNVGNCVSDAICFDVLGENQEMKYGKQRVWGTIGFGISALIGGIVVDISPSKSLGPALVVMVVFTVLDLISVTKLKVRELTFPVEHHLITNVPTAPQNEQRGVDTDGGEEATETQRHRCLPGLCYYRWNHRLVHNLLHVLAPGRGRGWQ